jgi:betaine-aldehyde dehydrogenase
MMRAQPEASHFIHGEPADEPAGDPFDVLYPATGETTACVLRRAAESVYVATGPLATPF